MSWKKLTAIRKSPDAPLEVKQRARTLQGFLNMGGDRTLLNREVQSFIDKNKKYLQ